MRETADFLNEGEARFMVKLLGLQGNKVTKMRAAIEPGEDWAAATTLERRCLIRRDHQGFYATIQGLNAVEHMMGSLTFAAVG